jgi:hypothetical protein
MTLGTERSRKDQATSPQRSQKVRVARPKAVYVRVPTVKTVGAGFAGLLGEEA